MSTRFKYKAISPDGTRTTGHLTLETKDQAVEFLSEKNLMPVEIVEDNRRNSFSLLGFLSNTDYENLIIFTNNLSTLFKAGIPLLRTLAIIKIGGENSKFNIAMADVRFKVESGISLSGAMNEYPLIFPEVYVASIAAGEESGKLDDILDELSQMLESDLEISRQIKSGIRYPIMVVSAIGLAFLVLMTYVIPQFISFYSAFGSELPLPTRIITTISQFMVANWYIMLASAFLVFLGFRKLVSYPEGKLWVDRQFLNVPIFGDLLIKGNVARFTLMLSILIKSGLPLVKSIDLLGNSIKNSMIGLEIKMMSDFLKDGQEEQLLGKKFNYFPELSLQMMYIGLESGSLDSLLNKIGQHYSKEVKYKSSQLTAILEPILTLVLGVFVLILALAVFLPMWNLIQVFKN